MEDILSQAGYPGGRDFPAVEYVYVDTPANTAVAIYLKELWASALNVEVTLRSVTEEEMRWLSSTESILLKPNRTTTTNRTVAIK